MRLLATFLIGTLLTSLPAIAGNHAKTQHEHAETKAKNISGNIYMLKGVNAGNVTISTGDQGTFIIDDKLKDQHGELEAAIKAITDTPITFILNTHYHFDHTGTNEYFGNEGVIIAAHDNVRTRLSAQQAIDFFDKKLPPMDQQGLPTITFADDMTFHYNDNTMHIMHVANAHTDGDALVYIKDQNIIVAGDLVFNGIYPFIDVQNGGSVMGVISGVKKLLEIADDKTQIIPGHGDIMDKAALQNYHDMLLTIASDVKALLAEGKDKDAIIAEKPTARFDNQINTGFISGDAFTGIIYDDLSR